MTWEQYKVNILPSKERVYTGEFFFINNSDQKIKTISARATCTCIEVKYNEENVKPGDKGKVSYMLNFDERKDEILNYYIYVHC